ncbi:hypothetical protein Ahy_B08g089786 isoform D [Arachis hypogaea]|uniref:Uncharacterized protein n=1 Tax=Arachis hypogaea TaxID=3818 RepID=A0A444XYV7_ARAHY|nr:hypothetical protein Ahy_B08g089786 isoform D [Arachis hypogaea]
MEEVNFLSDFMPLKMDPNFNSSFLNGFRFSQVPTIPNVEEQCPDPNILSLEGVELRIDGSINGETIAHATIGEVSSSFADEDKIASSSFDPAYKQDQDGNITQDSSGGDTIPSGIPAVSVVSADEPYLGQEFDSKL